MVKALIVVLFAAIVASLASGMIYLVKDKGQSRRTAKALTLRIGLSLALFALLFILFATGLITPHGIRP